MKIEPVMKENTDLKQENDQLRLKSGNLERDMKDSIARIANPEIKGVAKVYNENVSEVLGKICELIGEPIAYT